MGAGEVLALDPAGDVPVLVEDDGTTIAHVNAIAEMRGGGLLKQPDAIQATGRPRSGDWSLGSMRSSSRR